MLHGQMKLDIDISPPKVAKPFHLGSASQKNPKYIFCMTLKIKYLSKILNSKLYLINIIHFPPTLSLIRSANKNYFGICWAQTSMEMPSNKLYFEKQVSQVADCAKQQKNEIQMTKWTELGSSCFFLSYFFIYIHLFFFLFSWYKEIFALTTQKPRENLISNVCKCY